MADKMSIDKKDPVKEDTEESVSSSPEGEQQTQQNSSNAQETQENQQPKRKGGRKPIYATSEERKQRNRQAQAAFRERRTEYIKQLEEAIRVHEQNLGQLQAAHRNAADECLMLRYKNSLLERILLEKGIDVQAELQAKTGSPDLGPMHTPQNLVQPPPISRSLLNRHHSRRSNSSIAPKLEPGLSATALQQPIGAGSAMSPKGRHAASSHSASPTNTGSVFGASPATSGSDHIPPSNRTPMAPAVGMKHQAPAPMGHMASMPATGPPRTMQQQMQAATQRQHAMHRTGAVGGGVATTTAAPFYASPAFQNHIEQLGKLSRSFSPRPRLIELCSPRFISVSTEQEYDAAAEMIDDTADTPDTPSGPGPYPGPHFAGDPQPISLSSPGATSAGATPTTMAPGQHHPQHQQAAAAAAAAAAHHVQQHVHHHQHVGAAAGGYPSILDPGLDWDPFGLSASMAFPTQFSFDTSNMR